MPDMIVWDEERGYYSKSLSYGSDLGAPAIRLEDVKGWKSTQALSVNHQLGAKFEELKSQLEKLYEEYSWNDLIYNHAQYAFIPVIGQTYHLYRRDDMTVFLSLVEPECWKHEHLGSFSLDSSNKWCKT